MKRLEKNEVRKCWCCRQAERAVDINGERLAITQVPTMSLEFTTKKYTEKKNENYLKNRK